MDWEGLGMEDYRIVGNDFKMDLLAEFITNPTPGAEIIDTSNDSLALDVNFEFIRIFRNSTGRTLFNLKVGVGFQSCFKQVEVVNGKVVFGFAEKFIIYDLERRRKVALVEFGGYFRSFLINRNEVFVASDSRLTKLGLDGSAKWVSESLGIDGVIINEISSLEIRGEGEWGPPGGWKAFTLSRETGKIN